MQLLPQGHYCLLRIIILVYALSSLSAAVLSMNTRSHHYSSVRVGGSTQTLSHPPHCAYCKQASYAPNPVKSCPL